MADIFRIKKPLTQGVAGSSGFFMANLSSLELPLSQS